MDKIIEAINSNNYQEFDRIVGNYENNFNIIDRELLKSRKFNIRSKLDYCDKYDRVELVNNILKDIKLNYLYYNYYSVLIFSLSKVNNKLEKNNLLVKAFIMCINSKLSTFKKMLENYNYYDEFIEYIKRSNSRYLILRTCIFIDDRLAIEVYGGYKNIINDIFNSRISSKEKIEYYLFLLKKIHNDELISIIEKKIISIYKEYDEILEDSIQDYGEEMVECNRIKQDKYIKMIISAISDKKDDKGKSYLYK